MIAPSSILPNRKTHWLRFLTKAQKHAGLRFAKYRFKRKRGASDPDSCTLTLTGNHIPATLHQTLKWSVARHGLTELDVLLRGLTLRRRK